MNGQINSANSSLSRQSDDNDEILNDALNKCGKDVQCVIDGPQESENETSHILRISEEH